MTARSLAPLVLVLVLGVALLGGCKRKPPVRGQSTELTPLGASGAIQSLGLAGFGAATVALPLGATKPMPVIVAVLGIGDTPEEQCGTWHEVVEDRAFVLCPRGSPHWVKDEPELDADTTRPGLEDDSAEDAAAAAASSRRSGSADSGRARQVGFYPTDLTTLDREVTAALAALEARWGPYIADGAKVYAGFSRGAFLGASLVARHPGRFKRVILIEGGQSAWQSESASAFASGGGERVLFVCGQPSCVEEAEAASERLRSKRVAVRVVHGVGEGHGYKRQVKEELRRSLGWVTEGDARWQNVALR